MTVKVSQTYTPSLNASVTTRDGMVTRVTFWQTGVPGSTDRMVDVPKPRRFGR